MLLSLDWSVGISSKSAAKDRQNTKYKKNIPEQLLWEVSNQAVGVNTGYERLALLAIHWSLQEVTKYKKANLAYVPLYGKRQKRYIFLGNFLK